MAFAGPGHSASACDDRYVRSGVMRGPSSSAPYNPNDVPAREAPLDKTPYTAQIQVRRWCSWTLFLVWKPNPNMRHPTPQFAQVSTPTAIQLEPSPQSTAKLCSALRNTFSEDIFPATTGESSSSAARTSRNHTKLTVALAADHGEMWASQRMFHQHQQIGGRQPHASAATAEYLVSEQLGVAGEEGADLRRWRGSLRCNPRTNANGWLVKKDGAKDTRELVLAVDEEDEKVAGRGDREREDDVEGADGEDPE
ncbi:hypothetical protein JB92DRAFT_2835758 [Gautieria morchelliformis]|nr:hypothetical protein JB92DRAFT_2835758 [Gautieria morchelliformis]